MVRQKYYCWRKILLKNCGKTGERQKRNPFQVPLSVRNNLGLNLLDTVLGFNGLRDHAG